MTFLYRLGIEWIMKSAHELKLIQSNSVDVAEADAEQVNNQDLRISPI